MEYLDFDIQVDRANRRAYSVRVIHSPAGEAHITVPFLFAKQEFRERLIRLHSDILSSQWEQEVQEFGQILFDYLITGEVRSRYDVSQHKASAQLNTGLRIRLHISKPELAALPWEFLFDSRQGDFVCLSRNTPIIRYLDLPQSVQPLTVAPPLRILGMVANPIGSARLDSEQEKETMHKALEELLDKGLVELIWLQGQKWRDLHKAMSDPKETWHIFHFIGHGGVQQGSNLSYIELEDDNGQLRQFGATLLGRLLRDHQSLRLVILNACKGARSNEQDIFSSTASSLAQRGISAVIAMQYKISDPAAIEFSRTFYKSIASELPVDAAVTEARKTMSMGVQATLEWGTPVLFMHSSNGILFHLTRRSPTRANSSRAKSPGSTPKSNSASGKSDFLNMISFLQPNKLEFFLISQENGQYIRSTLAEAGNILLMGGKGMGKTNAAKSILSQLCAKNEPQRLHVALFDFDEQKEISTLFRSLSFPHIKFIVTDQYQAEHQLLFLEQELDRRRSKLDDKKHSTWLVIIEEFMSLQKNANSWRAFTSLLLMGTRHDIFILVTTRNTVLSEELLVGFETKMFFKQDEIDNTDNIDVPTEKFENISPRTPILFERIRKYIYTMQAKCDMCKKKICEYISESYTDLDLALAQQTSGLIIPEDFSKRFWENTVLEQVTRGPIVHAMRGFCKDCIAVSIDLFMDKKGISKTLFEHFSSASKQAQQVISIILFKRFGKPDLPIATLTGEWKIEAIVNELLYSELLPEEKE